MQIRNCSDIHKDPPYTWMSASSAMRVKRTKSLAEMASPISSSTLWYCSGLFWGVFCEEWVAGESTVDGFDRASSWISAAVVAGGVGGPFTIWDNYLTDVLADTERWEVVLSKQRFRDLIRIISTVTSTNSLHTTTMEIDQEIDSILYIAREISGNPVGYWRNTALTAIKFTGFHHWTLTRVIVLMTGVTLQALSGKADCVLLRIPKGLLWI